MVSFSFRGKRYKGGRKNEFPPPQPFSPLPSTLEPRGKLLLLWVDQGLEPSKPSLQSIQWTYILTSGHTQTQHPIHQSGFSPVCMWTSRQSMQSVCIQDRWLMFDPVVWIENHDIHAIISMWKFAYRYMFAHSRKAWNSFNRSSRVYIWNSRRKVQLTLSTVDWKTIDVLLLKYFVSMFSGQLSQGCHIFRVNWTK